MLLTTRNQSENNQSFKELNNIVYEVIENIFPQEDILKSKLGENLFALFFSDIEESLLKNNLDKCKSLLDEKKINFYAGVSIGLPKLENTTKEIKLGSKKALNLASSTDNTIIVNNFA